MSEKLRKYAEERDAALLSLDKKKIQMFLTNYGVPIPENEMVFWAGVHEAILHINAASAEQRINSVMWLYEHGFRVEIGQRWGE